jgi:hypothetical protein
MATALQQEEKRGIGLPEATVGGVTLATVAGVGRNFLRDNNLAKELTQDKGLREQLVQAVHSVHTQASKITGDLQSSNALDATRLKTIKEMALPTIESSGHQVKESVNKVVSNLGGMQEDALKQINSKLPGWSKGFEEQINGLKTLDPKQQAGLAITATVLAGLAMWGTNKVLQPKPQIQTDGYALNGHVQQKSLAAGRGQE